MTYSVDEQASPEQNSAQNAEAIKPARNNASNNKQPKKPQKKPPPVPARLKNPHPVHPAKDNSNNHSIEMGDLSVHNKIQQAKDETNSFNSKSHQVELKAKGKYPDELNPFAESLHEEGKATNEDTSNHEKTPTETAITEPDRPKPTETKMKNTWRREKQEEEEIPQRVESFCKQLTVMFVFRSACCSRRCSINC